ncbi:glycosyltransferase [Prochlorococcus marinus]|uniref:glycosyltransferase n=1 Tax=Prochlorococcus marinus TaxID=1219 RepID=UPI001ADB5D05|nr:glycosyltransferase [Prochlorococcus marinus]MBO8204939.1 glycosyltransferase [Prochlorococcus marinus CUG1415]
MISPKNKVIIHIISSITDHGAQKNLILFIKKIKEKGFESHKIISIKKPEESSNIYIQLKKMGIPIYKFNLKALFLNKSLQQINKKKQAIIFFGWMYHGMLIAFLMHKIYFSNSQLLWTIRHGEPFHKGINKLTKLIILTLSLINKYQKIPILVNSFCGIKNHIKIGFRSKQINYWPNFLQSNNSYQLKLPTKNKKEYIVLYPARYHPQKNHDMSLKVLKILKNKYKLPIKLILVGENIESYKTKLVKDYDYNNLFLNSIKFIEQRKNIKEYYKKSDIVISTSSFGEGLQNIILEGLYFGRLVFSTRAGDASRILTKEYLCNTNDHKIMAKKIAYTINKINNDSKFQESLICNHAKQIKKINKLCDTNLILETFIKNIK